MSLIDEARAVHQRIAARLQELEPLVREYDELRRAAAQLGIDPADPAPPEETSEPPARAVAPPRRSPGRRRSGSGRAQNAAPAAPARNGGELNERVLGAVRDQPGQTVADYARTLDLAATMLYRPVRELTTAGQIVKRNRQLYPS